MMTIKQEVWLCPDCRIAAVNNDFSGLDFSYGPSEAEARMTRIIAGLDHLGPHLVNDEGEGKGGEGHVDHSLDACDCCHNGAHGERYRFAILGDA